ncbi:GNAT family N-acetyltransferase [Saccharobesus litoralis]|nr:GNAT family N-acetyltransferase [Saccharobesus litoralis]
MIDVKLISVDQTYPLRSLVLNPNLEVNTFSFEGDDKPDTQHYAAMHHDEVLAIGSVYAQQSDLIEGGTHARLRGFATDPGLRNKGVGSHLLEDIEKKLTAQKYDVIWSSVTANSLLFYQKRGYNAIGSEIFEPTLGKMVIVAKRL